MELGELELALDRLGERHADVLIVGYGGVRRRGGYCSLSNRGNDRLRRSSDGGLLGLRGLGIRESGWAVDYDNNYVCKADGWCYDKASWQ